MPLAPSAVSIDVDGGKAHFGERNFAISDFFDILNAVGHSPIPRTPVPATVSFQVYWHAFGFKRQLRDADVGFSGTFRRSRAWIAWSADEPENHFRFKSDGLFTSKTVGSAVIGQEQNGVFFGR
ncbi:MAG TPA: hypothetical protein VFI42_01030 [Thermomicrobiaceae bacterium]|nr:hypothetical protein [Thermomicrobiaceae bacterium]